MSKKKKNLDGKVLVGKIVRAHGIKGDVYVHPFTDNPSRFSEGNLLQLQDGNTLEIVRATKHATRNLFRVHFKDVETRNQAEELIGENLYVNESDLPELDEGEFYIFQLIGLNVYDLEGNSLGVVKDLLQTGGVDVLRISITGLKKELLIPFSREFVKMIDISERKLVIDTSQLEGEL